MHTDRLCNCDDQFVSHFVTECVVDLLETVDVDEANAHAAIILREGLVELCQFIDARVAVVGVCHHVEFREKLDLTALRPADGDKRGQNRGE